MNAPRRNLMLGTAGHVDHGKTAVVKLLTGCDLDTLAEEKQRGMTIDLGFAPCRLANERIVGVIDVPGHADFIRNMVAGAHGVDVVILVVAADDGVMPQTREHLNILALMGVRHGLVALNKIDLVDASARQRVIASVQSLLAGTFLEHAPVCPLSTITGEGFEGFYETLNQVADACPPKDCAGLFHMWVEDVHAIHGAGTVVTGVPTRGAVRVGDLVVAAPGGVAGKVRRLQVYGQDALEGRAGECVAVNVAELPRDSVRRGRVLCAPDTFQAVTLLEARLELLPGQEHGLKDGAETRLHIGTAAVAARAALLQGAKLEPGGAALVQFRLTEPLAAAPGQRFVIRVNQTGGGRDGLATIGGGRILGVSGVKLRRNRPWTLAALSAREAALDSPVLWCETLLREAALPRPPALLAQDCQLRLPEMLLILAPLKAAGTILETPAGALVHRDTVLTLAERVLAQLTAFHAANPKRLGPETAELCQSLGAARDLVDLSCHRLLGEHRIEATGSVLALAGWKAQVTSEDDALRERLAQILRKASWTPPDAAELAASENQPLARIQALLQLLVEQGVLVRLDPELVVHAQAVQAAKRVVLFLFTKAPSFTTMDFRDALGISRKFAVPLLDHLDATRFTVRNGHTRTPGVEARKKPVVSASSSPPPP